MIPLVNAAIVGGLGGCLRAIVGFGKAYTAKQAFNFNHFLITAVIGILVGTITGMLLNHDWRLSFVSGYAGSDVLEGIAKLFKQGKGHQVLVKK